jgi:hypothetical protein
LSAELLIDPDLLAATSDAGNWLFCGRKWIDPADPDGLIKLDIHYHNLCTLFPAFPAACSHSRFIGAVAAVIDSWSPHAAAAHEEAGLGPPAADFAPKDTADDSGLVQPAQSSNVDYAAHSSVVCAAAADGHDPDDATMCLEADFAGLWPPVGLGICAPPEESGFFEGKESWTGFASSGGG